MEAENAWPASSLWWTRVSNLVVRGRGFLGRGKCFRVNKMKRRPFLILTLISAAHLLVSPLETCQIKQNNDNRLPSPIELQEHTGLKLSAARGFALRIRGGTFNHSINAEQGDLGNRGAAPMDVDAGSGNDSAKNKSSPSSSVIIPCFDLSHFL